MARKGTLWLLLLSPILLFYVLLFRMLTGLPFNDDYKAVLGFVLQFRQASGWQRLITILTHRHNEYLLIFQNILYSLQYELLERMHLKPLIVVGDLLVLPLYGVLWLLWEQFRFPKSYALAAFVPVSWMLFELQYASTLNCVMAPLQNVAVLIFTLGSFYFAAKPGRIDFAWTVLLVALSISASGGGLLVGPVVCLLFLQRQDWTRFAAMLLLSLTLGWLYLHFRYWHDLPNATFATGLPGKGFTMAYAAAFLGSVAAGSHPAPAIAFAAVLVLFLVYALVNRLDRTHPGLFYAILFFFVQALAVSAMRAPRGLSTALGSRYRINSVVLVILLYFFLAEKFRHTSFSARWKGVGLGLAAVVLLGFTLASDRAGYHLLVLRRTLVQQQMARWKAHAPQSSQSATDEPDYLERDGRIAMYKPMEPVLTESLHAGIYRLPPPGPNQ